MTFSALLPNVLALFNSPNSNHVSFEDDDDDFLNDDIFKTTPIQAKPGYKSSLVQYTLMRTFKIYIEDLNNGPSNNLTIQIMDLG